MFHLKTLTIIYLSYVTGSYTALISLLNYDHLMLVKTSRNHCVIIIYNPKKPLQLLADKYVSNLFLTLYGSLYDYPSFLHRVM